MSAYTDATAPRPGQILGAGDTRAQFLRMFGGMTLEAFEETFEFNGKTMVMNITQGKAETFPIIGRLDEATEHTPGERVYGQGVETNEVEITIDGILVETAFLADIDKYLSHFDLAGPFARQIGQSLARTSNRRIASTFINASRVTDAPYTGGPVPSYAWDAAMRTDPAKLEDGTFKAVEYIRENDIGGGDQFFFLPWQQQLLLSRYTGIDTEETSGSGNRAAGTVGKIAGLQPEGTNAIPKTVIGAGEDNRAKYHGDFTSTVGIIANSLAVGTLRRKGLSVRMVEEDVRLGTTMIGTKFEGHGGLRNECSFELADAERV